MDNNCIKRDDTSGASDKSRVQELETATLVATQALDEKSKTIERLEQRILEQTRTLNEQTRTLNEQTRTLNEQTRMFNEQMQIFERQSQHLAQLYQLQETAVKVLAFTEATPINNAPGVSPVTNALAEAPAAVTPVNPVASTEVDTTNATPAVGNNRLNMRRQRLRSCTPTERLIRKKRGSGFAN
ncbi:hypothetical protein GGI09_001181 [Coemansia sp. S100]|nr:hypothetical protein LPJ71_001684 [Coemansia sp. S17]KAJ2093951.1 hypothetical protein GGI16_005716 [Coemansia sp. S142-1]KAJ2102510.1 hypothetical protein GGI09_001181 [Coemansia sp. S100]